MVCTCVVWWVHNTMCHGYKHWYHRHSLVFWFGCLLEFGNSLSWYLCETMNGIQFWFTTMVVSDWFVVWIWLSFGYVTTCSLRAAGVDYICGLVYGDLCLFYRFVFLQVVSWLLCCLVGCSNETWWSLCLERLSMSAALDSDFWIAVYLWECTMAKHGSISKCIKQRLRTGPPMPSHYFTANNVIDGDKKIAIYP